MSTTHSCSGCTATWTGLAVCHCAAAGCHQTFGSISLFDAHRSQAGEHGHCLDPATILRAGQCRMFLRDNIWRGPEMPDRHLFFLV
jgi:hypothetical protein